MTVKDVLALTEATLEAVCKLKILLTALAVLRTILLGKVRIVVPTRRIPFIALIVAARTVVTIRRGVWRIAKPNLLILVIPPATFARPVVSKDF